MRLGLKHVGHVEIVDDVAEADIDVLFGPCHTHLAVDAGRPDVRRHNELPAIIRRRRLRGSP